MTQVIYNNKITKKVMFAKKKKSGMDFLKFCDRNKTDVEGLTKTKLKHFYDTKYQRYQTQINPTYKHFKFYVVLRALFQSGQLHLRDTIIFKGRPPPEYYNSKPSRRRQHSQTSCGKPTSLVNKSSNVPVKLSVDQYLTFNKTTPEDQHSGASISHSGGSQKESLGRFDEDSGVSQYIKQVGNNYECLPCGIKGITCPDLELHLHGRRHKIGLSSWELNKKRKDSNHTENGIDILADCDSNDDGYFVSIQQNEERVLALSVKNISDTHIDLVGCDMLSKMKVFTMTIQDINMQSSSLIRIAPGTTCKVQVTVKSKHLGNYHTSIGFHFRKAGHDFNIVKKLQACCGNAVTDQVKPSEPYKRPPTVARKQTSSKFIPGLPIPKWSGSELEKEIQLEQYRIPDSLRRMLNRGLNQQNLSDMGKLELQELRNLLEESLNADNYTKTFETLLFFEELQMEVDIRKYDMESVPMKTCPENRKLLLLTVPGLAENRPSVLRGDSLYVRINTNGRLSDKEYQGIVHEVRQNEVALGFSDQLLSLFLKNMKFNVRFVFNRLPLKLQHRASVMAMKNNLGVMLFPSSPSSTDTGGMKSEQSLRFFNRELESNDQQKAAIQNIVSGVSRPSPYIIFGPPGTGKTVTVVEAIMQIWKYQENSHILACAPSNNAADLIAERLLKWGIQKNHIMRLNASSRSWNTMTDDIKNISNLQARQYFYPPKKELKQYRVIVCTLVTAGRLVSANFERGHFTHIFVDEAGHAMEPECLIPLAGILCIDKKLPTIQNGQVVLAGDPKQLGPIIRSKYATHYGLDKSLLERLMSECQVYGREKVDTGNGTQLSSYDNRVVTKLLRNYRSHPSILEVPDRTFYENELICCADKMIRESLCLWDKLPKKNFPIIFHGVVGKDEREERSPSFFNAAEVGVVIDYVEKLLNKRGGFKVKQKDIGIISPYRKQVQKLQQISKQKGWNDISVGSVEEFQGQERLVIIVSTVRSNPDYLSMDVQFKLGFLKNPKRFNVTVTRAKALLIVVGNPVILSHDQQWRSFISFCQDEGGYVGFEFDGDEENMMKDIIQRLENIGLSTETESGLDDLEDDYGFHEENAWRADM